MEETNLAYSADWNGSSSLGSGAEYPTTAGLNTSSINASKADLGSSLMLRLVGKEFTEAAKAIGGATIAGVTCLGSGHFRNLPHFEVGDAVGGMEAAARFLFAVEMDDDVLVLVADDDALAVSAPVGVGDAATNLRRHLVVGLDVFKAHGFTSSETFLALLVAQRHSIL